MNNIEETRAAFEADLHSLFLKYGITSARLESVNFVRDYEFIGDTIKLTSEKAVVRALGKTRKIKIGENEPYKTYEEADKANREYWSAYFKERRSRWTEKELAGERRRQKRYRERRKARERGIITNQ